MKKTVWLWQLFGFAFTSFFGTVLHFLYDWLGKAVWIAPFSGVNESTWEHMKLIFWPMLIYALIQGFFFRDRCDFFSVKLRGILLALALIPILFYTYNGVVGASPDWINIAIFFISGAVAYAYEWVLLTKRTLPRGSTIIPFIVLGAIALLFVIFTFAAPELAIFRDPLSGTYGI